MGGDGTWTEKDRKLALALTRYEAGMCDCGYPMHICRNPENDGYFDISPIVCQATAAIEAHRNQENYKPDPGERLAAVYTRTEDDPLPVFQRSEYTAGEP